MVAEDSALTMAIRHVGILTSFAEGGAADWFRCFNIYCRANEWDEIIKARKLPTILEGEALAICVELGEDVQFDYSKVKKQMLGRVTPMKFASLEEFHRQKLHTG